MKALHRIFYFSTVVLSLSSCASFENLTDDRTRAEDDEMYWNGKELFYDNALVASGQSIGDDYYDPNSATRSNSMNGGTNPRASFNPISGWQLSYGLNAFSNYSNGFGMGLGNGSFNPYNSFGNNSFGYNPYGINSFGYNPYGYNSFGYNPYSSFNPYGGFGFNPYGYGMGGLGWGGNGFGNGWGGNGSSWGGSGNTGEPVNVTHHHRRPLVAGTGNTSTYNRGVLQKSLVQPISETARTPQTVAPIRSNPTYNYSRPTYARPASTTSPSPTRTNPSYNSPSRPANAPTYTSPSRQTPTHSTPSNTSPSRTSPSQSTPSRSTPSRNTPSHSSPAPSAPSRSNSPGKRP